MKPDSEVTKQCRYQRAARAEGVCVSCFKNPSHGKRLCDKCAARNGVKRRHPTSTDWDSVKWWEPTETIMKNLGVTVNAVHYQRGLRGKDNPHKEALKRIASLEKKLAMMILKYEPPAGK